jgi:hypothetical protein
MNHPELTPNSIGRKKNSLPSVCRTGCRAKVSSVPDHIWNPKEGSVPGSLSLPVWPHCFLFTPFHPHLPFRSHCLLSSFIVSSLPVISLLWQCLSLPPPPLPSPRTLSEFRMGWSFILSTSKSIRGGGGETNPSKQPFKQLSFRSRTVTLIQFH